MKTSKNFLSSAKWIFEVSRRFAKIDRNGRSSATNILSTLGICFGVMTLVAVVSVMNGFQAFSINPIMEISSAHLRASEIPEAQVSDFLDFCAENPGISSVSPFFESQGLIVGKNSKQAAAVVRAVSPDILNIDKGFGSQVKIVIGKFNLDSDGIVLGKALANVSYEIQLFFKLDSTNLKLHTFISLFNFFFHPAVHIFVVSHPNEPVDGYADFPAREGCIKQ